MFCVKLSVKGKLKGLVVNADLPHFFGYKGYFGGVGEVICEGFHAP